MAVLFYIINKLNILKAFNFHGFASSKNKENLSQVKFSSFTVAQTGAKHAQCMQIAILANQKGI